MKPANNVHNLVPEYPRTRYLIPNPNAKRDDLVCSSAEYKMIWTEPTSVQEKIDGSQCRMTMLDGHPIIGNRNHILDKAYSKVKNASKMQFSSIWSWWYEHKHLFEALAEVGPYSVYGDWMYMQHGMEYTQLPSLFMTYDLYDYEQHHFVNVKKADAILREVGFSVVPLLHYGPIDSLKQLEDLAQQASPYADERREGVYLKVCSEEWVEHRFKVVRPDFEQGKHLDQNIIKRNKVIK